MSWHDEFITVTLSITIYYTKRQHDNMLYDKLHAG